MGKKLDDSVFDAGLDEIRDNCNLMVALPSEPADYAAAVANQLADVAMAPGDFTKANGDVSGRKLTVAAKNGVLIDTTGTYTHVALLDTVNTVLLAVSTGTSQALTAGNTMNFPAWDIELRDPT